MDIVMDKAGRLELLQNQCSVCTLCPLSRTRHSVVFSVGNPESDIMFIGEGPGEQEDLRGEPFVGPAGQLLDIMLKLIGLDRKTVYIANIVKCRPPSNRDPAENEKTACFGYLARQIEIINPKIIVCLGRIAATAIIRPDFKITREHGKWYEANGRYIIATYHPSALLRDMYKRPDAFSDFREIRKKLREVRQENAENRCQT